MRDGIPRVDGRSVAEGGGATDLLHALRAFGCGVVVDAAAVCDAWSVLLGAARRLHAAEPAVRYGAWRGRLPGWRGYQPSQAASEELAEGLAVDPMFVSGAADRRHSAFDVGPPWSTRTGAGTAQSAGILDSVQPWPALAGFADEVTGAFVAAHGFGVDLAHRLLDEKSLPPATIVPSLEAPCSSLRLLRYDPETPPAGDPTPPAGDPTPPAGEPHIDYELLTLIASDAPGLQVKDAAGEWRQPGLGQGDLLVMAGDTFEATTHGAVGSALHRVTSGARVRHSVVVFVGVEFGLELLLPSTGRRMPFGQYLEGMLVRTTPELWSRYEAGALPLPYALPEPNPFKGEPWPRPGIG